MYSTSGAVHGANVHDLAHADLCHLCLWHFMLKVSILQTVDLAHDILLAMAASKADTFDKSTTQKNIAVFGRPVTNLTSFRD